MKKLAFGVVMMTFVIGCAAEPLTEDEQLHAEMKEQERQEMFVMWREWCERSGYVLYIDRARGCSSSSLERGCIPPKLEWDYRVSVGKSGQERLRVLSNTYSCVAGVR
jgi:phage/plasmid-associated DNA primase